MRWTPLTKLAAAVVVACALVALVATVKNKVKPDIRVAYGQVTMGPIVREVMSSGTLEPATSVDAGAQVSGTVQSLEADFNSVVRAGQVIATLDPSSYDTKVTEARAQLIQARSEAERTSLVAKDAALKLSRAQDLASRDLITEAELDAARVTSKQADAEHAAAAAAVQLANAEYEEARVLRDRTIIRSPIDGIVVNRSVEVGQTLASSFESPVLFSIANLERMRLLAEIDEADVGGVREGTPVTFTVESLGNQQFTGQVVAVRLQPIAQQPNAVGTSGSSGSSQPASRASAAPATQSARSTQSSSPASQSATGQSAASTSSATAANSSQASTSPSVPAGSVISYTAVVDVDNSDGRLTPGATAVLNVPAARRSDAIRIPNRALAFHPPADVLEQAGQSEDVGTKGPGPEADPAKGRAAQVWTFEDGRFKPIAVRVGLSDGEWTELLSGEVRVGDRLVTDVQID